VLVFELYLEQRIRQCLYDHRHHFNCIFLRQTVSFDKASVPSGHKSAPSASLPIQLVSWASGVFGCPQAEEDGGRYTHHLQVYRKSRHLGSAVLGRLPFRQHTQANTVSRKDRIVVRPLQVQIAVHIPRRLQNTL
jgi:hypothetical protein